MDDSQLCGRTGISRGASDRRYDRMGGSRRPCQRDHRLGLPRLLDPFSRPCASMAGTGALALSGSTTLASFAAADARSCNGAACSCSAEGEFRDVNVVPTAVCNLEALRPAMPATAPICRRMGKPEVISSPVGRILRGTSPICTQTIADGSAIIMPAQT
jgi:hypothetical protein